MSKPRPTLYLDKGAIGALDLHKLRDSFQICYSEATLFDLLNDQSQCREAELSMLNDVHAHYYYRDSNRILSTQCNAIEMMEKVDPLEIDMIAKSYRFLNGGGTESLHDLMWDQLSTLLRLDDEFEKIGQVLLTSIVSDPKFESLKTHKFDQSELQRAAKSWTQKEDITLRSIFEKNPDLFQALKENFPNESPKPEQIHLAAMLLGILQLGSDKGILSPQDYRSIRAARNGYVDCLHIMFGLHCQIFLTTDKATLRRFHLLNDYWRLGRLSALVMRDKAGTQPAQPNP